MTTPHDDTPSFWDSASPPSQQDKLFPLPNDDNALLREEPGPGLSIGAIVLVVLSLPSSLLLPPFAALLAIVGIALAGLHVKRSTHKPKIAIVAVSLCAISLVIAIGMTFYAYLAGPTPGA
ncbi:hypothetical protein ACTXJ3_04845 [Brachybacterium paraconglomeratum]|uniref:hypothetical protein n=1 Tax=Brachybacterium paraconglomeratum TaxID=173362 RepID=UPI003FD64510